MWRPSFLASEEPSVTVCRMILDQQDKPAVRDPGLNKNRRWLRSIATSKPVKLKFKLAKILARKSKFQRKRLKTRNFLARKN